MIRIGAEAPKLMVTGVATLLTPPVLITAFLCVQQIWGVLDSDRFAQ
jgi:hypothetical protein